MKRPLFAVFLLLGASQTACAKPWPVDTPPPAVEPAPARLKRVRVYVHQLLGTPQNAQDRWDYYNMSGLTSELRKAFMSQLQLAGYTVIVDRNMPHDLTAVIQAVWPNDRPGVATMILTAADGAVIEQLSASIPFVGEPPRIEFLEGDAAVQLVDEMSGSTKVSIFAQELSQQTSRPPADATIAR
ncbi:MAG: hypothetical protein U0271_46830 [Polyangiaceae bacterium]